MDEIKFRAWDKENKKWIQDFLITPDGSVLVIGEYEKPKIGLTNGWIEDENVELMQYTGLKDKNGKEIYEGDILGYWGNACWQVGWSDRGKFDFLYPDGREAFNFGSSAIKGKEIIGNIYENSDLIK